MRNLITAFLNTPAYHSCLLLVHPDIRRLEDAASELVSLYGWPRLSIGRDLSAALLAEPSANYSYAARQWLETKLSQIAPGPVLCTEIDLLFEPALKLDPLGLLRQASRVTKLVVTWPGNYLDGTLSYAVPAHCHSRTWRQPEVAIACL
jgi:hypothetical protein